MAIQKIDHIGIAVKSIEDQKKIYEDLLGLQCTGCEENLEQQVKVAFYQIGTTNIELLEPISDTSPIARFLEKHGEGIHHIAIQVEDLQQALDKAKRGEIRLIDSVPRQGAHGNTIAFLHPKSTGGVLFEFCQKCA